ncbi:MAG TPA: MarR family transcriptional regulator [Aeromicrobium sp.]|nr:MarR family transcriptional regulator [Aeromicrobium sp.]
MASASEIPWLTDAQQRSWRAFLGGVTVLMDSLDRDLRSQHGLSLAEYEVLVRLSEAPARTMRMAELADRVALSRSRITHTVARLEEAGILRRERCDEDGRGVQAVLIDEGLKRLEEAADTHVRGVQEHLIAHASDKELASIGAVMERVLDDLHGKRF